LEEGRPCGNCGWIPLQPTELKFVDDQLVTCPHCSRPRPVASERCPICGKESVLEDLSRSSESFHLSTLLIITTLLAVCLALMRVALPLGIALLVFLTLTGVRTAALIRERKRHRYPVTPRDLRRLFGASAWGVCLGMLTLVVCLFGGGFVLAAVFTSMAFADERVAVYTLVTFNAIALGILCSVYWRERDRRRWMLIGFAAACVFGLLVFTLALMTRRTYIAATMSPFLLIAALLGALFLSLRRGGAVRARSYLVGFATGLGCLGVPALFILRTDFAISFEFSSLLIWPALVTFFVLENHWSWDDAFPRISRIYASPDRMPTPFIAPVTDRGEPDEGIEFTEEERADDLRE
jgi:hypothetical protein